MKAATSNNPDILRNALGAFSDGAVLFPLLALLSSKVGFSGSIVLLSTGFAYLVSAFVFRVPMSVQPLKSIAVAAITLGASFQEVRLSGLLLGSVCLILCFLDVDRLAKKVPSAVIHQLQVGLGALLIFQGIKSMGDVSMWINSLSGFLILGAATFMVFLPEVRGIPILGLTAAAGLFSAVFLTSDSVGSVDSTRAIETVAAFSEVRPSLIAGLLLPQIVLTLGNSVLATHDVCHRYFGLTAWRVSVRRLLYSIGFGNVLVALVGGMPYCHGSGGVTAHVRGGSTHAGSTALMGGLLLIFAVFQFVSHSQMIVYPAALVSVLLITTGAFHLKLAAPTATTAMGWLKIASAFLITVFTRNLLWVLAWAVLLEGLSYWMTHSSLNRKYVNNVSLISSTETES